MIEQHQRRAGFTLVEAAISLAIFGILVAGLFSLAAETTGFLRENEGDAVVQMEGNRAYGRALAILRKSGRVKIGGLTFPRVTAGGAELQFRVLRDLDGNGYAFDEATGALEWDPALYALKVDAGGSFDVYRGSTRVHHLGRFIRTVAFRTIDEDPSLHLKEIQLALEARKPADRGFDLVHAVSGSIYMRN